MLKKRKDNLKKNDPPNSISIVDSPAFNKHKKEENDKKESDFELEVCIQKLYHYSVI